MMSTKITVIGAGAWGTTLAALLAGKGLSVRLWVREPELAATMCATRENTQFLPGITLPDTLQPTSSMPEALADADLVVMAVPSRWMRATARELAQAMPAVLPPIMTVTKGLEIETGKRMSEIIVEEIPGLPAIAALSGPNLAPEIAKGDPAATVIASVDAALAERAQELFMTGTFRPYVCSDIIGLEVCGAVKNVIAIAGGICEGLGFGDNAKAALLTRAVAEIGRLVQRLGGRPETVAGLSGIGDLMATCASPMSRNHRVGLAVGRGQDYRTALGDSGQVAEGVPTTEAVVRLARRLGVEMPICEQVSAILFEGRPASEAVLSLMTRMRKREDDVATGIPAD
ncbi:MAG TPA: NAD(P)H-dependent glycerol-3-phosphate dehydrogenase [Armatimonadota bacterium]|jgi:glycerol-3-phosphate dehydrogenase (NAD(P)+)